MVLLEYKDRDTILHRLSPITKFIWLVLTGVVLSIYMHPLPLLPLFILTLFLLYIAGVPWRGWLNQLIIVIAIGTLSFFFIGLWVNRPDMFIKTPYELANQTFIEIAPEDFILGRVAVTYGGLLYTVGQSLRSTTLLLTISLFVFTTSPTEIISLLQQLRVPHKLMFVIMVAYRFFPEVFRKLSTVVSAQKLRGWEVKVSNPINIPRQYFPLAVPLLSEAIRLSDRVTISAESRGFGSGVFTVRKKLSLHASDYIFIGIWVFITTVYITLFLMYGLGLL